PLIRDVDMVLPIDGDAERPGRTGVTFAPLEELGEQLLFAGAADLHLVDTHPEVVLVAAIGDVGDAALREAHRLGIVEPRARLRATPDGVAPLVDSSTRHRCKRHASLPSALVQEGRLLEPATGDRFGIQLQPLLENRRVDAAEVRTPVQVALNELLGLEGGIFAVVAPVDLVTKDESGAGRTMVRPRAVVVHASPELREQQDDDVVV